MTEKQLPHSTKEPPKPPVLQICTKSSLKVPMRQEEFLCPLGMENKCDSY